MAKVGEVQLAKTGTLPYDVRHITQHHESFGKRKASLVGFQLV